VMHDFSASPVQAGLTVGATVLGVAVMSPFIGMLSDAIGRKVILCTSMFLVAVPTVLIALAHSLDQVIVLRFMQGLSVPGVVVVFIAYLAEECRTVGVARMTALYVGGTVMGGFSGRFITGHLAEGLGWRGAFVVLALLNLGGALLTFWRLPRSRAFVPSRDFRGAFRTLGQHLRNQRLGAACAVGFCALFSLVGSFTYVNLHLAAPPFSLSAADLGNVFAVYLVGVVVTPMAGRYLGKLGFRRSLLAAMLLSATGLMLTLVPVLPVLIVGLVICSSGLFVCQSVTISFIGESVSTGRSLATGLYYLSYYMGGAAGSWLAGVAYERGGWTGSVGTIVAVQILAAGLAFVSWPVSTGAAKSGATPVA